MVNSKKKDLAQGAAAVGAAAIALASGPIGVIAAALPTVVSMGFDAIKTSDQRRAAKLVERMIAADESPAEFAADLQEKLRTDQDVIAAFRMLVASSIESVASDAIEPIALIGRKYLRGECPGWVARGWLRVLVDLTASEIDQLRGLIAGADALRRRASAAYFTFEDPTVAILWSPRVRMQVRPGHLGVCLVPDSFPPTVISVDDVSRIEASRLAHSQIGREMYANDYAERLFAELERFHLARVDHSAALQWQRARERERDEALANGKKPLSGGLFESAVDIVFDETAFAVIVEALNVGEGPSSSPQV